PPGHGKPAPFPFSVVSVSTFRHEVLVKRKSRTPSRSQRPGRLSVLALGIARQVTADWWDGGPATHPRLRSNPRQPIRYRRHDTSAVFLDVSLGDAPGRDQRARAVANRSPKEPFGLENTL